MCGKPKVNYQNPEADARIAAEQATIAANKDRAARKVRAGRDTLQSLSALGVQASALGASAAPAGNTALAQSQAMGVSKVLSRMKGGVR